MVATPNTRVQRARSSPPPPHSPLTRCSLGGYLPGLAPEMQGRLRAHRGSHQARFHPVLAGGPDCSRDHIHWCAILGGSGFRGGGVRSSSGSESKSCLSPGEGNARRCGGVAVSILSLATDGPATSRRPSLRRQPDSDWRHDHRLHKYRRQQSHCTDGPWRNGAVHDRPLWSSNQKSIASTDARSKPLGLTVFRLEVPPDMRVQRTRSSPSAQRPPLTRRPLGAGRT